MKIIISNLSTMNQSLTIIIRSKKAFDDSGLLKETVLADIVPFDLSAAFSKIEAVVKSFWGDTITLEVERANTACTMQFVIPSTFLEKLPIFIRQLQLQLQLWNCPDWVV